MDKAKLYDAIRKAGPSLFGVSISQAQVDGTEAIIDEAMRRSVPLKHLAYILATAFHETAKTMKPIEEYGKGRGRSYGNPVPPYNKVYYGRGFVQLTWIDNYKKASQELATDFVKYPERALEPTLAAAIMFEGMADGWFTGKKLSDYITDTKADYINARRIINGTDRASQIAGYAVRFQEALIAGGYSVNDNVVKLPVPPPAPVPAPVDPAPAQAPWLTAIINAIVNSFKR